MSAVTHGHARVLIAFYSRTGSVEALAGAVAEGVRTEGAEVRLRRAREIVSREVMAKAQGWVEGAERMNALYEAPSEADAEWADAIVFGTPTRFGSASSELRAYIDGLGALWSRGMLNGKAGSVFGASASAHGGNESTLLALYNTLAHLGMIIVPLGYSDMVLFKGGTPYGATAVTGQPPKPPSQNDLDVALYQGRRVARIAAALRAPRCAIGVVCPTFGWRRPPLLPGGLVQCRPHPPVRAATGHLRGRRGLAGAARSIRELYPTKVAGNNEAAVGDIPARNAKL